MASRRPPSTRSKATLTNSSLAAPSSSRSRSALSKPIVPQQPSLATTAEEPAEQPQASQQPPRPQTSTHNDGDAESNIRVVIRCRRRSEREIQENSPIICTTDGAKGDHIMIEAAAPVSSLGVVTLPPTRTYPFDAVFGPEADQALIFNDVVNPLLDEVLQGYNCTLFAYGQTGTGKTYTMQGDLTTTRMGNPSREAGMIPRVLIHLFNHLESSAIDYSVKISFVELYNEELRDLLAADLPAPAGSTQPMGMGTSKDPGQVNLKLFEDSNKKGIIIQGLEEAIVANAAGALALLTKGSHRRQIAATKFNDHSSRSHSVFSVTVCVKDTTAAGEEFLRTGKLNLVDLAGSENIGRSGAENKRAREAGMINQSLLTLGRVINALVDRSSHVPYRESKLTRLLQDSLGGRTKTCIIATVSPARCNMEETLSTLDYALRAKSIRNRPEINQRVTKNAMLKEYAAVIERLRADLCAAREKTGIILAEETFNQMAQEKETLESELIEARKEVEMKESQLKHAREEFEQCLALLMRTDEELKATKHKLKVTEEELSVNKAELQMTKGALEEETVVREAYQYNEGVLDDKLNSLKTVAGDSVQHIGGLEAKLDRTSFVFASNRAAVSSHGETIGSETQAIVHAVNALKKSSGHHSQKIKTEVNQLKSKEVEALVGLASGLRDQVTSLEKALKAIRDKEELTDSALQALRQWMDNTRESVKVMLNGFTEQVRKLHDSMSQQLEGSSVATLAAAERALAELVNLHQSLQQKAEEHIIAERTSLEESKATTDSVVKKELHRQRGVTGLFYQTRDTNTEIAKVVEEKCHEMVSNLFAEMVTRFNETAEETGAQLHKSNAVGEEMLARLSQDQDQRLESAVAHGSDWGAQLSKQAVTRKRARDAGMEALTSAKTAIHQRLSEGGKSLAKSAAAFSSDYQREDKKASTAFLDRFEDVHRAKRARLDVTESAMQDVRTTTQDAQSSIASTSKNLEAGLGRILSEDTNCTASVSAHCATAAAHLSNIRQTTKSLAVDAMRENVPTGSTPRKRSWTYVEEWPLIRPRETLLREAKLRSRSPIETETVPPEHIPLPEEESEQPAPDNPVGAEECEAPVDEPALSSSSTSSSPTLKSLSSSASSTVAPPVAMPRKRMDSGLPKSKLPSSMGTLTERPTNIVRTRASRR